MSSSSRQSDRLPASSVKQVLGLLYGGSVHTAAAVVLLHAATRVPGSPQAIASPYAAFLFLTVVTVYSADHLLDKGLLRRHLRALGLPASLAAGCLIWAGPAYFPAVGVAAAIGMLYYLIINRPSPARLFHLGPVARSYLKPLCVAAAAGIAITAPALTSPVPPALGSSCLLCLLNVLVFERSDREKDLGTPHPNPFTHPAAMRFAYPMLLAVFIACLACVALAMPHGCRSDGTGWFLAATAQVVLFAVIHQSRARVRERTKVLLRSVSDLTLALPAMGLWI